ncbi:hypothetical protein IF1G_06265 [Cordyceps javanica]|uniref:Uncharacterized protein n=1 Tax=Cordyceps javanica TaxID=43265 RepID=A0A545V0M7_9HYPO|nr:hypothetical protein IF1G_06265 [Cordyceps javanica]
MLTLINPAPVCSGNELRCHFVFRAFWRSRRPFLNVIGPNRTQFANRSSGNQIVAFLSQCPRMTPIEGCHLLSTGISYHYPTVTKHRTSSLSP